MNDKEVFDRLIKGDKEALGVIYRTHRDQFVKWAIKNYGCTPHEGVNLFVDALLVLEKNVQTGKLTELTATLLTYIIGVAVNLKKGETRIAIREQTEMEKYLSEFKDEDNPWETSESEEIVKQIVAYLDKMGPPCAQLIKLFYFEKKSDLETKELLNYESKDVVKNMRARCMKTLREKFKK
jgi:DNA-directed RNA polymerase specialized sigma24 family protein